MKNTPENLASNVTAPFRLPAGLLEFCRLIVPPPALLLKVRTTRSPVPEPLAEFWSPPPDAPVVSLTVPDVAMMVPALTFAPMLSAPAASATVAVGG